MNHYKSGFICRQNGVQENKTESLDTTSARVTFEPRVEITTISREGAHPIATVHANPPPSPGDRVASLPEKGKWNTNNSRIIRDDRHTSNTISIKLRKPCV